MKSFKEINTPTIHTGVDFREVLTEAIEATDYYNFVGAKEHAPKSSDYVTHGLIRHPIHHDAYAHPKSDGRVVKVSDERFDEVSDSLKRTYKKSLAAIHTQLEPHYDKFDDADLNAIDKYTKNSTINKTLLNNPEHADSFTKSLDTAIAKHQAPDTIAVFSGTSPEHAKKLRSSDSVFHPAYLSTSTSINSARAFAAGHEENGDIIKINIPKGHPSAYVASQSTHSGEREMLLPKGLTLNIDRSKEQVLVGPYGEYKVHHATIQTQETK